MVWFKVDDTLAFHQKTLRAGNAAMGMWVRAGSECASQLTDGFVSNELVAALGGHALAGRLVVARLWVKVDGGYQFHEWSEEGRQPTRAQVEEERKQAQLRKARWKERKQNAGQNGDGTRSGTESGTPSDRSSEHVENSAHARAATRPDPTRPDHEEQQPQTIDRFDEFWAAYPKHVAKQAARRRWDTRLREGVDPQAIIDGARAYARQVNGSDPQFVKQPDGWLLAGRWEDERAAPVSDELTTPDPWDA